MKKTIFLFFMIMFMIGTDTFLISPLLPALEELYNVSTEISGWMVSAYALGYALFALIAGPISDGLDRKRVIIGGMIFFSISTFLCGISPIFWWVITFRFLYVRFHNFSAVGMFTAIMYIFSLFIFKRAGIIQNIESETKQKIVS